MADQLVVSGVKYKDEPKQYNLYHFQSYILTFISNYIH